MGWGDEPVESHQSSAEASGGLHEATKLAASVMRSGFHAGSNTKSTSVSTTDVLYRVGDVVNEHLAHATAWRRERHADHHLIGVVARVFDLTFVDEPEVNDVDWDLRVIAVA